MSANNPFFESNFTQTRIKRLYQIVFTSGLLYFLGCLAYCHTHKKSLAAELLVMTWVIGPPLWFYFEYVTIVGDYGRSKWGLQEPSTMEGFKYSQDLASKVWVALALILFYAADLKP